MYELIDRWGSFKKFPEISLLKYQKKRSVELKLIKIFITFTTIFYLIWRFSFWEGSWLKVYYAIYLTFYSCLFFTLRWEKSSFITFSTSLMKWVTQSISSKIFCILVFSEQFSTILIICFIYLNEFISECTTYGIK